MRGNSRKTKYANGDTFEGEWENYYINGFGVYKTANGAVYEG